MTSCCLIVLLKEVKFMVFVCWEKYIFDELYACPKYMTWEMPEPNPWRVKDFIEEKETTIKTTSYIWGLWKCW